MFRSLFFDFTQMLLIVGVLGVLLIVRKGLMVVRLRPIYRRRLDRILPVIEIVSAVAFVVWVIWLVAPDESELTWWMAGALALAITGAGWFAVRDLVSGVVLRSENSFAPGQWIQTEQLDGFILNLGYRTMEIETDTGLQVKLPYSKLAGTVLGTADRTKSAHAHTFFLDVPNTNTVAEHTTRIRTAALTAFWSSPQRDPYVHYVGPEEGKHRFEVTVFCMDEAYATDLERFMRRQLERDFSN